IQASPGPSSQKVRWVVESRTSLQRAPPEEAAAASKDAGGMLTRCQAVSRSWGVQATIRDPGSAWSRAARRRPEPLAQNRMGWVDQRRRGGKASRAPAGRTAPVSEETIRRALP